MQFIVYQFKIYNLNIIKNFNFLTDILKDTLNNQIYLSLIYALGLSIKTIILVFSFIWVRASFPRIRYDQLMSFCWTILLPVVIAIIVLAPCVVYSTDIITNNINLL